MSSHFKSVRFVWITTIAALGVAIALVAPNAVAQQGVGAGGGRIEIDAPKLAPLDTNFTPEMRAADAVKAGEEALKRTAKAYRDAKTFQDTVAMRVSVQGQPDEMRFVIRREDGAAMYETEGMRVTAVGGEVILVNPRAPNRFVAYRAQGGITRTLVEELGGFTLPLPTWLLEPAIASDVVTELAGAVVPEPKLAGFDAEKGRVLVVGTGRSMATFDIDGRTGFLSGGRVQIAPVADSDFVIEMSLSMQPSTAALKEKIAFSKDGKDEVSGLDELQPKPLEVGSELPAVSITAGDGLAFKPESMRGKVLVLTLWADWNRLSERPLPHLDRFAKEMKADGKPVELRALCMMYALDGEEKGVTRRKAGEAWRKLGHEMPVLLADSEEISAAWGVSELPTTIVIGPDGKILAVHRGLDPQMPWKIVEQVREACLAALDPVTKKDG